MTFGVQELHIFSLSLQMRKLHVVVWTNDVASRGGQKDPAMGQQVALFREDKRNVQILNQFNFAIMPQCVSSC